jgi:hypothetical protein
MQPANQTPPSGFPKPVASLFGLRSPPIGRGNRFAHTVPTQGFLPDSLKCQKCLILLVSAEGLEPSTP